MSTGHIKKKKERCIKEKFAEKKSDEERCVERCIMESCVEEKRIKKSIPGKIIINEGLHFGIICKG